MKQYTDVHVNSQMRATQALIKFCEDHDYVVDGVEDLRLCLKCLKRKDMQAAVEAYLRVPLGRMGCFDDWLPQVVFSHETPEYARAVFEALVTEWNLVMQLAKLDSVNKSKANS